MKILKPEQILCTPETTVKGIPRTGVYPVTEDAIYHLLTADTAWFGPRNYLEAHTEFLQVVPYVVLRHGSSIAMYERASKGTEQRLHHLYSIGFGGHIQISDAALTDDILNVKETIGRATAREMTEESIHATVESTETCGLILLDDEPVSLHHLGVLQIWDVASQEIETPDEALNNVRFVTIRDVLGMRPNLESWSKAVITFLTAGR